MRRQYADREWIQESCSEDSKAKDRLSDGHYIVANKPQGLIGEMSVEEDYLPGAAARLLLNGKLIV